MKIKVEAKGMPNFSSSSRKEAAMDALVLKLRYLLALPTCPESLAADRLPPSKPSEIRVGHPGHRFTLLLSSSQTDRPLSHSHPITDEVV